MNYKIRPIALYLPQYHPIPENDKWWGRGFTEWTNVTRARPLFKGHWQPRLPTDLGFYDLRVPEVREAQALLAKEYGIYGFCYWHYWFAGKQLIERPFQEVVESGKPDFPFCVAWANQTWEGTWHGLAQNQKLIEQTYPGKQDHTAHFYSLLPAFRDKRYIEVNGKKLVFVFRPADMQNPREFIETWQTLALKEGLKGIHFVGMHMPHHWNPADFGYDAMIPSWPSIDKFRIQGGKERRVHRYVPSRLQFLFKNRTKIPKLISYREYVKQYPENFLKENEYPWICTDWDNTPRAGVNGWLFEDATPELFGELSSKSFRSTENKSVDEKFVIIKSWNEWAEGNVLEPDNRNGKRYLEMFKQSLDDYTTEKQVTTQKTLI